jgi:hypothetical protein
MSEQKNGPLTPEQNKIVHHVIDALDKIPTLRFELEGRDGPSFTNYKPINKDMFFQDVDALKLLIDIANHTYKPVLPKEDIPHITQFDVDTIPDGERIFLNATAGNFKYNTSTIIKNGDELFVSIKRFKKDMKGPNANSSLGADNFIYTPGEYFEGVLRAKLT